MKQSRFTHKLASLFVVGFMLFTAFPLSAQAADKAPTTSKTPAASKKLTDTLKYEGVTYGKITLSGNLSSGKQKLNIEGKVGEWYYNKVAKNSTCTIEPAKLDGCMSITLDSYVLSNGVYKFNERDDWMTTQLVADGKSIVGFGTLPYTKEYKSYFTSPKHPASFTFGRNTGTMPIYDTKYDYTLKSDGTLYILRCAVYDKSGKLIVRFNRPYLIGADASPTAAAEDKTKTPASSKKTIDPADLPPSGDPVYSGFHRSADGIDYGPYGKIPGYDYIPGLGYLKDEGGGTIGGGQGAGLEDLNGITIDGEITDPKLYQQWLDMVDKYGATKTDAEIRELWRNRNKK